jgi:hypothetical protein
MSPTHKKDSVVLDVSCAHKRLGGLAAHKRLGGLAAHSISGKHDDKYFKPNLDMQLSFKKRKTICAKIQSRKIMKKNQVI